MFANLGLRVKGTYRNFYLRIFTVSLLNQNIYILNPNMNALELYDALCDRLNKANALLSYSLGENTLGHLQEEMQYYLWTLDQLLQEALEIGQKLLPEKGAA